MTKEKDIPLLLQETVTYCHCEGVKGPKQSYNILKILRLPRSLWLLGLAELSQAMTGEDYDTASQGRGEISVFMFRGVLKGQNEKLYMLNVGMIGNF